MMMLPLEPLLGVPDGGGNGNTPTLGKGITPCSARNTAATAAAARGFFRFHFDRCASMLTVFDLHL